MAIYYILIALGAVLFTLAVMAPREYEVKRSIVIERDKRQVYEFLRFLENMDHWSVWARKDPNMKKELRGTDGEVGAVSAWRGNKDVGEGEHEITRLVQNERIESRLRFFKPWKSESDAFLSLKDSTPGSTEVEWGFRGVNKVPFNILMLFMNMDSMIGKDFEEGLQKLKEKLEE